MDAEPRDEAAQAIALGRMTDEAGRFIDQQELRILIDDIEQAFLFGCFHWRVSLSDFVVFVSGKAFPETVFYFSVGDSGSMAKVLRKDSTRFWALCRSGYSEVTI